MGFEGDKITRRFGEPIKDAKKKREIQRVCYELVAEFQAFTERSCRPLSYFESQRVAVSNEWFYKDLLHINRSNWLDIIIGSSRAMENGGSKVRTSSSS
uniref:Uncharacterized protein n=1 Tax=Cucumis melo TaxID=3656 RepID=A0A9I9EA75_CUCME